jgi:hypothetical protein
MLILKILNRMFSMKKTAFILSIFLLTAPVTAGFYAELSAGSVKNKITSSYSRVSTYHYNGE